MGVSAQGPSAQSEDRLRATPALRFEALDSWRGLAAIMVVLFHAQIVSNIRLLGVVRAGEAFVDLFFVLSGFVIAHAYLDRLSTPRDVGRFFVLRLGRLYPLHVFMLGLFLLFEIAKGFVPGLVNTADPAFTGTNQPSYLVSNILLLQGLWPQDSLSWNTPSWSISAEYLAYLLFAVAAFAQRKRIALWLCLAAIAAPLVLCLASPQGMLSAAGTGFLRAVYGFSVGALLYRLLSHFALMQGAASSRTAPASRFGSPGWTALEVLATVLAVVSAWKSHATPLSYGLPFVFAMLVGVFAQERGAVSYILRRRPLVMIGMLSYSIYMIHMFIQLRLLNLARLLDIVAGTTFVQQVGRSDRYGGGIDLGSLFAGDLLIVAMVAVTIAASFVTYRLIERPGQQAFRRLADHLFGPAVHSVERGHRPLRLVLR